MYKTYYPNCVVYNIDAPEFVTVTIFCHDSLSGLSRQFYKAYTVSFNSPIESFSIGKCCEDNAGNLECYTRVTYSANTHGRHSSCGVQTYHSCRTSGCGLDLYNYCENSACGIDTHKECWLFGSDCNCTCH